MNGSASYKQEPPTSQKATHRWYCRRNSAGNRKRASTGRAGTGRSQKNRQDRGEKSTILSIFLGSTSAGSARRGFFTISHLGPPAISSLRRLLRRPRVRAISAVQ